MKCKKLILLITTVMILLLTTPASAAGKKTKITGKFMFPDIAIDVTVPASTNAYLNPKRISVKVGGKVEDGQILTDPAYIENKTVVPVLVSASVTGSIKTGSSLTLVSESTKGKNLKYKSAFIYFEMQASDDPTAEPWASKFNKDKHILVIDGSIEEKEDFIKLGSKDEADRYGVFHLAGDCVTDPKDDPWNSKDGITAAIVFTFRATKAS